MPLFEDSVQTSLLNPAGSRQPLYPSAFDELRTASPYILADLTNKYSLDPVTYGTQLAVGGTAVHVPNQSAIALAVTTAISSSAELRTNQFFRYQAGRGLRVRLSVIHSNAGQTGQVRQWGFFDQGDGLFYQLSGTTLSVVRRTSTSGAAVDDAVAQAAWNVDPLNGTGPSGVTLDVTKGNIYEISFQWLGVGIVQFFVNGILVHELLFPNTLAVPYMKTAVLPVAIKIANTALVGVATTLTFVCGAVHVDGGAEPPAPTFGAFNSADKSVSTTEIPVLSIRLKSLFNAIQNRMLVQPLLFSMSTEGSRAGFRLILNPTLTAPAFVSADTESGVEFDTAATAVTGGTTLIRSFLANANDVATIDLLPIFANNTRLLKLNAFATQSDILTVTGVNEAAGTTLMRASLAWKEFR